MLVIYLPVIRCGLIQTSSKLLSGLILAKKSDTNRLAKRIKILLSSREACGSISGPTNLDIQ